MRRIVFDIETKNFFSDTGSNRPDSLDLAVVCIYDSQADSYGHFFEEDLPRLWRILEKADVLVGFNSEHFDIPILNKYYSGDLRRIPSIDLMKEIKGKLGRRIGLDAVAAATLGAKKSGSGILANIWWRTGERQKVVEYCIDDVRLTKELYDYMRAHGHVKYRDGKVLRELPIDTSRWEAQEVRVMTQSLPF